MNQHLRVALHSLVKFVVGDLGLINPNFMAHDETGLGLARDDEISQISIVLLDVALTRGQR